MADLPPSDRTGLVRRGIGPARRLALLLAAAIVLGLPVVASDARALPEHPPELADLTIEELMSLEVTSASRKSEELFGTAAAIYVLTGEDILRSGATSIPEALRLVPGLTVAQIDANKWAISARGLNGRFANKLLVLIDGRTAYSPLFGGVFWDVQNVLLENVDRIEVIRGPGGTLWGANAVNGVVNIITKSAGETIGTLATVRAGDQERAYGAARYGSPVGERSHYRVSAMAFDRDARTRVDGAPGHDDWSLARMSARLETKTRSGGRLLIDGSGYEGDIGGDMTVWESYPTVYQLQSIDGSVSGGHLLAEWSHRNASGSGLTLRGFYDVTHRDEMIFAEDRETWDLELHARRTLGRHELLWGVGARGSRAEYEESPMASISPDSRTDHRWSAYIQDEVQLVPDEWRLVFGSKFEHNDFTGFEVQPNLRVAWTPHGRQTYWAAVSRAVRIPAAALSYGTLNHAPFDTGSSLPGNVRLLGNPDLDSEIVLALEAGLRAQVSDRLLLDAAVFRNDYDDIGLLVPSEPFVESDPAPPHLVAPLTAMNAGSVQTWGLELASDVRLSPHWRVLSGYSYLHHDTDVDRETPNAVNIVTRSNPGHQAFLRAIGSWGAGFEVDLSVRYVDDVDGFEIDGYTTADLRVGWDPDSPWSLGLVGRNLFDADRLELIDVFFAGPSTQVPRSFHAVATWSY